MNIPKTISPLFYLSLLLLLSLSYAATPPSSPLSLNLVNETLISGMTNTNPPFRYYHLQSASASNDNGTFGLIYAWPLDKPPFWLRAIPRSAAMQVLSWVMRESVAHLDPEAEVGREYLTFGPEYRKNMNFLDERVVIRQYYEGDWEEEPDVPREELKNKHIAEGAAIGGNIFGRGQVEQEVAFWMCYITPVREIANCVGILMVQMDVWQRKDFGAR
ncbi:MAG: hypothetical protein LQ339_007329 [Xanthoria mediterranea]|nr:MAG: hypothetical protein LQ339_007329 [Xanthoria mediterranea]